jgi:hypothetical protein
VKRIGGAPAFERFAVDLGIGIVELRHPVRFERSAPSASCPKRPRSDSLQ